MKIMGRDVGRAMSVYGGSVLKNERYYPLWSNLEKVSSRVDVEIDGIAQSC